jgi:hypothetical protein
MDQSQNIIESVQKGINTHGVQIPQIAMNGVAKNDEAGKTQAANDRWYRTGIFIRMCVRTYVAALMGSAVTLPIAISAVTVGFYLSDQPALYSLIMGALTTCGAWLLVSAFCYYFATARGANARSYGLIKSRVDQLKAHLGIVDGPDGRPLPMTFDERLQAAGIDRCDECSLVALREAHAFYADINETLRTSPAGLEWLLATGYINIWSMIHRAEEALIEVEPASIVIREAMHDKLAIQGSGISNRDELCDKLMQAVKDLDPLALCYFHELAPDKRQEELLNTLAQITDTNTKALGQLARAVKKLDASAKIEDAEKIDSMGEAATTGKLVAASAASSPEIRLRARVVLREIRRTLNCFRDGLWEGLIRARNLLLGAITITGVVTHALLCIAILTSMGMPHTSLYDMSQSELIAAVVFYIVGAIAGLFGRFYKELLSNSGVDDYGLSLVRLIATPLLSGLGGVGGVLVTALVYGTLSEQKVDIHSIFQLSEPRNILAAAIFGLTPNLIIRSLQQRAEKYASDLQNSKAADGGGAND